MIDPDSPSPSSDQPSDLHREHPDCLPIVPPSMPVALESAQQHDDEQWTRIVVESLQSRSREAKEALLKALLNDQPARSTGSSSSMDPDWGIGEPEVSRDAVRNDQTQASSDVSHNITSNHHHGDGSRNTETSPRTVPPPPPLRSNASAKASGKDRLNGQCTTARSIPSNPRADPVGCTTSPSDRPAPFARSSFHQRWVSWLSWVPTRVLGGSGGSLTKAISTAPARDRKSVV